MPLGCTPQHDEQRYSIAGRRKATHQSGCHHYLSSDNYDSKVVISSDNTQHDGTTLQPRWVSSSYPPELVLSLLYAMRREGQHYTHHTLATHRSMGFVRYMA